MKIRRAGLSFSVFLLIFVIVIIVTSFSYEPKARLVPLFIGLVTLILIGLVITNEIHPISLVERLNMDLMKVNVNQEAMPQGEMTASPKRLLVVFFWICGFFIFIFLLGFHASIALFILVFLKVEGRASWTKAILTAGIVSATIFAVFELAMRFSLYKGWLFGEIVPRI